MTFGVAIGVLAAPVAMANPFAGDALGAGEGRRPVCVEVAVPATDSAPPSSTIQCSEPLLRDGARSDQDAAVLATLDERVMELGRRASAYAHHNPGRTWLVEVFYPNLEVSHKVDFAAKTALLSHGQTVSDRSVWLAAADVRELSIMPPQTAYPLACGRYVANQTLTPGHLLMGVVVLSTEDATLQAGVCDDGEWAWL